MSFHSGVVVKCSAHTSCKSHLTPSSQVFKLADCPFSKWKKTKQKKQNQPRGHCGLSDCHAGCFCCMSLPLMYRLLFSLLAAALQEPRTSRDMRQNKTDSELKVYYCEEKKKRKKRYFILCCFISTFSEGMSSWGFNHRPRSSTGQHVFYC